MSEHVIELNGKRYDAVTGAQLGSSTKLPLSGKLAHRGKVIDGFVRNTATKKPALTPQPLAKRELAIQPKPVKTQAIKPIPPAAPLISKPSAPAKTHPDNTTHQQAKRRPERSKTLMRSTVKRPAVSIKPAIKPQPPAEVMAKPVSSITHKRSVGQVDNKRMERAVHTPKHNAITRFHHKDTPAVLYASGQVTVPVIAVRQAPAATAPASLEHQPVHHDIFEAAMHRATSHKEPHHEPKRLKARRRLINTFAGVSAFLVLAGFIGYLNMPTLELRFASMQAGFHASIPDYRPTGFALTGGIDRAGGTISLNFRSGASAYTLTQQASNWNSQTLLDSTLALSGANATVLKNGQTVYIYDAGTSAAWVNSGVRYDLTGNASLTKDDIASIATSL